MLLPESITDVTVLIRHWKFVLCILLIILDYRMIAEVKPEEGTHSYDLHPTVMTVFSVA